MNSLIKMKRFKPLFLCKLKPSLFNYFSSNSNLFYPKNYQLMEYGNSKKIKLSFKVSSKKSINNSFS